MIKTATETEQQLQLMICEYLKLKYPNAIFNSDGAGNNLSRTQRGINTMLRSGTGYPDLLIAEPRHGYHGMFLELKCEGTTVYLKDGSMSHNSHVQMQAQMLARLKERGYYAEFGIGWDDCMRQVDEYLAN